jgi:hypothetical protein
LLKYFCIEVVASLFSQKPHEKKETVTRTFRIDAELDDVLEREAERQGISVNHLVNSIFQRYALCDRLARSSNFISMTKHAFREILKGISLEHLAEAGENTGSKDIQDVLDMLGLPSDYDSFTYLIANHFGGPNCAMWFNCYRSFKQNRVLLHLQHDLGREWSVYLQNYFLSYLKTLKVDCETTAYDYAVNIRPLQPHRPILDISHRNP